MTDNGHLFVGVGCDADKCDSQWHLVPPDDAVSQKRATDCVFGAQTLSTSPVWTSCVG